MINLNISKRFTGKNIKIGKNYPLYCKSKIEEIFKKYATKVFSYDSCIIKEKYFYKVKLKVVTSNNTNFESSGKSKLPYEAVNIAILTLKKIIRRYSRINKNESKKYKQIRSLKQSFYMYNDISDGNISKKIN